VDPDADVRRAAARVGEVLAHGSEGEEGLAPGALDAARREDEVVLWVGRLVEDELGQVRGGGGDLGPGRGGRLEGLGGDGGEFGGAADLVGGRVGGV